MPFHHNNNNKECRAKLTFERCPYLQHITIPYQNGPWRMQRPNLILPI